MIDIFNKLNKRHNYNQTFSDFIELAAISISNKVDKYNYEKRELRFKEISTKYNSDEIRMFSNLLAKLTVEMYNPRDVLGEKLMELEEGNSKKGQYFTPYHICKMKASLAFDEKKLQNEGFLVVNEPSCGGGALIIALYEIMLDKGYNPQQQLKVIADDIDLKSVHMCYLQLSLLGVPANIRYSNAITGEIFDTWKTPNWISGVWDYRKK